MLCPSTTSTRAEAKPAAKLLTFGLSDGRYKNPEPEECGGMIKISYLPGGRFELVVFGFSPCGGGGGGGPLIVEALQNKNLGDEARTKETARRIEKRW